MWLFDGATGAEYESTFGFWKQDLFPLEIANKLENWPIQDQEQRPQKFDDADELGFLWDDAHHPGDNNVGAQYQDYMPMMSLNWLTESSPDIKGEVSTFNTAPEPEIVVVGQRIYWYVYLGDPSDVPVPNTDTTIQPTEGGAMATQIELFDACPVEQAAANTSLSLLYIHSPTARALIDTMGANGTALNLITASLTGLGAQARFDHINNQVTWDPFVYTEGTNIDGSTYTLAPIMVLAHELVHAGHAGDPAYQLDGSETLVMQIANQIAAELNEATGSNYDTTRDSHVRDRLRNTTSPTSTFFSIARPGCPG